ncbi:MAG TPA: GNAT family N-acetyltransferase [Noviherbaspirillum sp.]
MRSFLPVLLHWTQQLGFVQPPASEVHDTWRLRDGTAVTLRAARVDDDVLIRQLVRGLSTTSRYQRFFYPLHELPPKMMDRFTHNAPLEAMTLLAVVRQRGRETCIAMAQYVADPYPQRCDFAVVVADGWQRHGLGKRLVQTLACLARAAGIKRMEGDMLAENKAMTRLMVNMGFRVSGHEDGAYLRKVTKELDTQEGKCSPMTALVAQVA